MKTAYQILRIMGWAVAAMGGPGKVGKRYLRKQGFRAVRKVVD